MITNKDFVHLHLHTSYSILDGMIKIDDLVNKVVSLGMKGVAITDHGSIAGVIHLYDKAKENNIKPIIGAELYLTDDRKQKAKYVEDEDLKNLRNSNYHLVLLAKDFRGYKNLVKLVTKANLEGFYYKPRIDKELLSKYSEGLIVLTSCLAGEIPQAILQNDKDKLKKNIEDYISIFGKENVFVEFQYHGLKEQVIVNKELINLAKRYNLRKVITNDAHYLEKSNYDAHDVLLCVQTKKKKDDPNRLRFSTNEFYVKSVEELYSFWGEDFKDAFLNTVHICDMLDIKIPEGIYYLPHTESSFEKLRNLCYENLPKKYPNYDKKIIDRIEYELSVIDKMGFCDYFLIVWDFISWAKSKFIPVGPGRGSVGGSIVAYLIGITQIDPIKYGLIFERFLNPGRKSLPDIDTDFCQDKRDLVIDYCIEKYGRSRVCNIGAFGSMKARAAVRDVARVLGLSPSWADNIAKMIPMGSTISESIEENLELKQEYSNNSDVKKVLNISMDLEGLIRNQSVHASGIIISSIDIDELIPLVKINNVIVSAYDMNVVERLGFVKMDFLGLRTLTLIDDVVKTIEKVDGIKIDVYNIPLDDKKTFDLFCNGDTVGVFQTESSGFRKLLRELKPSNVFDIISALALYRPGPLESGLVKKFVESKNDPSTIEYLHPDLEDILKETYGVIVYQEQIMMIANKFANFTLSQADDLRKAMGKKKPEIMEKYRSIFIEGCLNNGYSEELAKKLFDIIEKFAGYGFNKSHSAAYGILTYITAYLKANYPYEYLNGLLKSVEGNPKKLKIFINESFRKGIKVLPPDINKSNASFDIEVVNGQKYIRFGLLGIKGLGEAVVNEIISKRTSKFLDINDFYSRVNHQIVNKKAMEILVLSGCFDSLHNDRNELYSKLEKLLSQKSKKIKASNLFSENDLFTETSEVNEKTNKSLSTLEILKLEKEYLGVYLTDHPMNNLNIDNLEINNIYSIKENKQDYVEAIGVITNLQEKITKKGKMCIFDLDDPSDSIEVVVYSEVYQKNKEKIKEGEVVLVEGKLIFEEQEEAEEENIKIICQNIKKLDEINFNEIDSNQLNSKKSNDGKFSDYVRNDQNKQSLEVNFFVEISDNFPESDYVDFLKSLSSFLLEKGDAIVNFEIYNNDKYCKVIKDRYINFSSIFVVENILKNRYPSLIPFLKILPEVIVD